MGIVRSGEAHRFRGLIRSAFDKPIAECRTAILEQAIEQFLER